jgi:hypothetical protein
MSEERSEIEFGTLIEHVRLLFLTLARGVPKPLAPEYVIDSSFLQQTVHFSAVQVWRAVGKFFQVRGPACGSMVPETCFVDARSSGRISVAKLDSYGPDLFGAFSARIQV